jgi:hypothetical protein
MDSNLFNKKLSKISFIAEGLSSETSLSALERDLLLSYIRELYEIALDTQSAPKVTASVAKASNTPKEKHEEVPVTIQDKAPLVEKEKAVSDTLITNPKSEEIHPKEEKVVESPEPKDIELPVSLSDKGLNSFSEEVRELFEDEKVQDLSDKLSLTPIKDLTRSMGINERVHYQTELFGNNREQFVEALDLLNKMDNFDQATQYILNKFIIKNEWASEKKSKVASQFIKLVKRRYM